MTDHAPATDVRTLLDPSTVSPEEHDAAHASQSRVKLISDERVQYGTAIVTDDNRVVVELESGDLYTMQLTAGAAAALRDDLERRMIVELDPPNTGRGVAVRVDAPPEYRNPFDPPNTGRGVAVRVDAPPEYRNPYALRWLLRGLQRMRGHLGDANYMEAAIRELEAMALPYIERGDVAHDAAAAARRDKPGFTAGDPRLDGAAHDTQFIDLFYLPGGRVGLRFEGILCPLALSGEDARRMAAEVSRPMLMGPEPADNIRIKVRLDWQDPEADMRRLFIATEGARGNLVRNQRVAEPEPTVELVLPFEAYGLLTETEGLHEKLRAEFPFVVAVLERGLPDTSGFRVPCFAEVRVSTRDGLNAREVEKRNTILGKLGPGRPVVVVGGDADTALVIPRDSRDEYAMPADMLAEVKP